MRNVLVTGGKGQLATCIKDIAQKINNYKFIYADIGDLDITNAKQVNTYFKNYEISYCINCAAYTAVDQAESNKELAKSVNIDGAKNLAEACVNNNSVLIHISTDFVFDGKKTIPYNEEDLEKPLNIYGTTKLNGEKLVSEILKEHIIIRTSWLYSEHGNNFLKTMLRLGRERDEISVVVDQVGTPTYAGDLARLVVDIVKGGDINYGTYHYSNEGVASWYDFAWSIFDNSNTIVNLIPIKTQEYPTPAQRPRFSVMDKTKSKEILKIKIPHWTASLKKCLNKLSIEE